MGRRSCERHRTGEGGGSCGGRLSVPHFAFLNIIAARLRQARDEDLTCGRSWLCTAQVCIGSPLGGVLRMLLRGGAAC